MTHTNPNPPATTSSTPDAADSNGVKQTLTPTARNSRRGSAVENKAFAGFCRRIVAAHARRVGSGDVEALADLLALSAQVDAAILDAVQGLRAFGYTWAEIARPLGMTRQAAYQRWGTEPTDPQSSPVSADPFVDGGLW